MSACFLGLCFDCYYIAVLCDYVSKNVKWYQYLLVYHYCTFLCIHLLFLPERDEAGNLCIYASRNFYWISFRTMGPKRKASLRRGMTLTTFLHYSLDHSLPAVLEEERCACAWSLGQRFYRETCSCKWGSSKELSAYSYGAAGMLNKKSLTVAREVKSDPSHLG